MTAYTHTYLMLVHPETGYWAYLTAGRRWQASCAAEDQRREGEGKLHNMSEYYIRSQVLAQVYYDTTVVSFSEL